MDLQQQEKNQPHIVQIMTTEHYNLQSGRSLTVSDANGRAGFFLSTVSTTSHSLGTSHTWERHSLCSHSFSFLRSFFWGSSPLMACCSRPSKRRSISVGSTGSGA